VERHEQIAQPHGSDSGEIMVTEVVRLVVRSI
jgi:hypothetical protein